MMPHKQSSTTFNSIYFLGENDNLKEKFHWNLVKFQIAEKQDKPISVYIMNICINQLDLKMLWNLELLNISHKEEYF
jgi:hypothetical protein